MVTAVDFLLFTEFHYSAHVYRWIKILDKHNFKNLILGPGASVLENFRPKKETLTNIFI
jgi:hypothetical protein